MFRLPYYGHELANCRALTSALQLLPDKYWDLSLALTVDHIDNRWSLLKIDDVKLYFKRNECIVISYAYIDRARVLKIANRSGSQFQNHCNNCNLHCRLTYNDF